VSFSQSGILNVFYFFGPEAFITDTDTDVSNASHHTRRDKLVCHPHGQRIVVASRKILLEVISPHTLAASFYFHLNLVSDIPLFRDALT
jgi:hypothetical protein